MPFDILNKFPENQPVNDTELSEKPRKTHFIFIFKKIIQS